MPKPYTTEQFWQMYETLPEEIKNALWAPETGDNIAGIIEKNALDEYHDDIVDLCSQVFVGVVLPQQLARELEKLGIPTETAQMAAQQLNALVFYPAKLGLEKLHKQAGEKSEATQVEIPTPRHSDRDDYVVRTEPAETLTEPDIQAGGEQAKEDPYREKAE